MDTVSDAPQDFTMTAARPRVFSRRSFIKFAATVIAAESAAGILAACGGSTTAPMPTTAGRTVATTAAGSSAAAPTVIRSSGASAVPGSPAAAGGTATTAGIVGPIQAKVTSGPSRLVLAQTADPSTLDPQFEQSGIIGTYLNPMVEHLMDFNRDLAITNVLADTAQQPADGVTYRFKLRPNMKFWDGVRHVVSC